VTREENEGENRCADQGVRDHFAQNVASENTHERTDPSLRSGFRLRAPVGSAMLCLLTPAKRLNFAQNVASEMRIRAVENSRSE